MKILCNKCFQEVKTVEYDCGIFVEPCECAEDITADREKVIYDEGWRNGNNAPDDMRLG